MSKPDRVREMIKETIGKITKTEIMIKCPDISQVTVQRALNDLVKSGEVIKIGGGRYIYWDLIIRLSVFVMITLKLVAFYLVLN